MKSPIVYSVIPPNISFEKRLNYLREWMVMVIDAWPEKPETKYKSFYFYVIMREAADFKHVNWKQHKLAKKQCFYCERPFDEYVLRTRDHIIPQSEGGFNYRANIVWSCGACNHWKRSDTLPVWLKKVELFIDLKRPNKELSVSDLRRIRKNILRLIEFVKKNHVYLSIESVAWIKKPP